MTLSTLLPFSEGLLVKAKLRITISNRLLLGLKTTQTVSICCKSKKCYLANNIFNILKEIVFGKSLQFKKRKECGSSPVAIIVQLSTFR